MYFFLSSYKTNKEQVVVGAERQLKVMKKRGEER